VSQTAVSCECRFNAFFKCKTTGRREQISHDTQARDTVLTCFIIRTANLREVLSSRKNSPPLYILSAKLKWKKLQHCNLATVSLFAR
jgi:hypothetical protein